MGQLGSHVVSEVNDSSYNVSDHVKRSDSPEYVASRKELHALVAVAPTVARLLGLA